LSVSFEAATVRHFGWYRLSALSVLSVVTVAVFSASAPSAMAAIRPSLRLFESARRITVTQNDLRYGTADLGLWIASVGGDFQIDVRRPGYGAWNAVQVNSATAGRVRSIPAGVVNPIRGLKRFLSVQFVGAQGHVAARREVTFCPNGQAARVNDSGLFNSTYLSYCQDLSGFPFVRGEVWGIDSGWAVSPTLASGLLPGFPFGALPPGPLPPGFRPRLRHAWVSLKPGRYTAIVRITGMYRKLFGIAAGQAVARVGLRVWYSRPPRVRPPVRRAARRKPEDVGGDLGQMAVRTTTSPDPMTMPNLVAAPAWRIAVRRQFKSVGGRGGRRGRFVRAILTFSATIWDAGPAPFTIEGFRRPHSDLMDAYEYFFDPAGNVVGRAPAGTLEYDTRPGHNHWHLRQLASYELVGRSRTITSHKQSFCIAPTDPVDLTMPGAEAAQVAFGFGGTVCDLFQPGSIWVREELPAGWGDTYTQQVAGQAFDLTNVPNGSYKIVVRVNPLGVLRETSTADDVAVRRIRLMGPRDARRVEVAPWRGISG
jgi:hypothetical protein